MLLSLNLFGMENQDSLQSLTSLARNVLHKKWLQDLTQNKQRFLEEFTISPHVITLPFTYFFILDTPLSPEAKIELINRVLYNAVKKKSWKDTVHGLDKTESNALLFLRTQLIVNRDLKEILFKAIMHNNSNALHIIASRKKYRDEHNSIGKTPLHLAIEVDDPYIVQKLLKTGANPHGVDDNGLAPLHYVKSVAVAELLVEAGAHVTIAKQDKFPFPNYTPIDAAKWCANDKLYAYLCSVRDKKS